MRLAMVRYPLDPIRLFLGAIGYLSIVGVPGCSSFTVYHLSNGVDVVALRDMSNVYPVFASTFKAEVDEAVKTKEEALNITANGKFSNDVVKLYQELDNLNMDVRNQLVTAYTRYVT